MDEILALILGCLLFGLGYLFGRMSRTEKETEEEKQNAREDYWKRGEQPPEWEG